MNFKGLVRKGQFQFNKHKGLIYTLVAAGLEIAAVVITAIQAPKAEKVLVPANKKITKLKEEMNDEEAIVNHQVYPEDNKKEIRKIQFSTIKNVAKIYAVPAIMTGLSLTFLGGSYKVMRNKELALGAAYFTLDSAFKSYRGRVQDKLGNDAENEIFRNIKEEKIKKLVENPQTGEIQEIEETIKKANGGGAWEILFDAASLIWSKDGRTNWETLMRLQEQANIRLKRDGYLFLYDVIEMLDIPKTCINQDLLIASRSIGWIYDPYDSSRSSWVSFGISDEAGHPNEVGLELFNCVEKDVWLSFNPDGNIQLDTKTGKSFAQYARD
jgi:hypothetical protein